MKKIILSILFFSTLFQSTFAQELITSAFLQSRTKESLQAEFGPFISFGVDLYKITYTTPDIYGVTDTASGLFCIPSETWRTYPFLIYQHGTVGSKVDVPSNLQGGYQLAMFWAGVGYMTCAPDYLGLGEARGFHPYVHAATEASAAIDMVKAAQTFPFEEVSFNDQLFITGYSQGGHAAAAVQKAIEDDPGIGLTVTAAAPMSGPYSVSGVMKNLLIIDTTYYFPAYGVYTAMAYNDIYAIFATPGEVFKEPIASWALDFYNHEIDLGTLNGDIINWLESNYGASIPKHMFLESVVDELTNNPDSPFNLALIDNDLFDWAPQAPTRIFYCTADDQVPFNNSVIADNTMNANGAPNTLSIDVDSDADHGACVEPAVTQGFLFFLGFQEIGFVDPEAVVELNPRLKFQVSPNPASDVLNIKFANPVNEAIEIEIMSLDGKILQKERWASQTALNISNLSKGIYVIKARSEKGIWLEKVVVL